jgi:hypothetical protein
MEKRRKKITFREFKQKHNLLNSINFQFIKFKPNANNKFKFINNKPTFNELIFKNNKSKGSYVNYDINNNDLKYFFNRRKKKEDKNSNKLNYLPLRIEPIHNPVPDKIKISIVDQNKINNSIELYNTNILNIAFDNGHNRINFDDENSKNYNNRIYHRDRLIGIEEPNLENQNVDPILELSMISFNSDDTYERGNNMLDKYHLIERKFGDKEFCEQKQKCVICLEEYVVGDIIIIFPCLHSFHKQCIYNWFNKKETCPLCNLDIKQLIKMNEVAN